MDKTKLSISLANSVIMVADKFINKVETGRAHSSETYSDMQVLKREALLLKGVLEEHTHSFKEDFIEEGTAICECGLEMSK